MMKWTWKEVLSVTLTSKSWDSKRPDTERSSVTVLSIGTLLLNWYRILFLIFSVVIDSVSWQRGCRLPLLCVPELVGGWVPVMGSHSHPCVSWFNDFTKLKLKLKYYIQNILNAKSMPGLYKLPRLSDFNLIYCLGHLTSTRYTAWVTWLQPDILPGSPDFNSLYCLGHLTSTRYTAWVTWLQLVILPGSPDFNSLYCLGHLTSHD